MLLEFPNSKDPQDAEVAKMMNDQPERFALVAHEWAVKYASAPRRQIDTSQYSQPAGNAAPKDDAARYVTSSPISRAATALCGSGVAKTNLRCK